MAEIHVGAQQVDELYPLFSMEATHIFFVKIPLSSFQLRIVYIATQILRQCFFLSSFLFIFFSHIPCAPTFSSC